jgi:hypothetical protein
LPITNKLLSSFTSKSVSFLSNSRLVSLFMFVYIKLHFCSIRAVQVLFYSSGTGFVLFEQDRFYSIRAGLYKTSFLFYSSRTGFVLFERYRFCSIRAVQVLFYSSGTGFVLFERYRFCSIRTVRCRVLQVNLGKNCGAKSAVEKCGRGTQKKSYP